MPKNRPLLFDHVCAFSPTQRWALTAGYLLAIFVLTYVARQADFGWIAIGFGSGVFIYTLVIRCGDTVQLAHWIGVAIAARILALFAFPNLSDDVYRFLWDGYLARAGYNPFAHLPVEWLTGTRTVPAGITQELFDRLNSPKYFTIYPPVAQWTFRTAVTIFPDSWWAAAVLMKCILVAVDIGNVLLIRRLLRRFHLADRNVLLYALHPLMIVELNGNLHHEGVMIFFLLLAIYIFSFSPKSKNRRLRSTLWGSLALALSVTSKLLTLLFFPFLIRRLGFGRALVVFAFTGTLIVLLFLPFLDAQILTNFSSSLDLYFRKFEFNASVYYVLRWIGYQTTGYNQIAVFGPWLAVFSTACILGWAALERRHDWGSLCHGLLFAITIYLICTPTVHPWYTALPLVLCVFTTYRFPVIWCSLVWLTYANYAGGTYQEHLWIVGIEYTLVFLYFAYEWWNRRPEERPTFVPK